MKIGDIVELTIGYMGYHTFQPGTKAEVVGRGRNDIIFIRILGSCILLEAREEDSWIKRMRGAKVIK